MFTQPFCVGISTNIQQNVTVKVTIDLLQMKGQYTLSSLFTRSSGDFLVNLTTAHVIGHGKLQVQRSGQLQAEDINMDIVVEDISLDFQNLGFMGSLIQGILNSIGTFLFDSIKPFILQQVNTNIRGEVNRNLLGIPQRFPNSIPPLDMAIAEARRYVRDQGYDPYRVEDYHYSNLVFSADISHVWLSGLASFHRVGDVSVNVTRSRLRVDLHVGTGVLEGRCHWEVGLGAVLSRPGTTSFTVDYLQVRVLASQPLDVRNTPVLEDLQLELGNIQMRFDGAGTADYVVELAVNVLPNLLRYQIVNALEKPLKKRIQEVLDSLDIEEILEEKLPQLDRL
ncbi:uncharacterized protein LOC134542446 isoform X2 [Bacillus rossius redtenbacheri]|uniref:uncharacterized protein LOC134542446 isoform X2 n=1 Tax=Bacillus rossius redtenbacheri TaxID=93214 RepID=UPI002FDD7E89